MPKVTLMGAGSAVFARQLMTDILAVDGLDEGTFALVDIDVRRLDLARRIAERLVSLSGKSWTVTASTERRDVLADTDFLISTFEVAGLENVRHDYDIPLRYGVDQCIGDTIGPGGIFKALRTGPVWLDVLADAEHLCPGAWVLNYVNPMSILTLVALTGTSMRTVGLCHSVQHTSRQIAGYLDIPYDELIYRCAGINHNAWFLTLRQRSTGEDLYPRLRRCAQDPGIYRRDPVRFDMLLNFGAFVTESSGHFSEYVPYYRKRPDLLECYTGPGYNGESGYYANNWPVWRREKEAQIEAMLAGMEDIPRERGTEYASTIIEAMTLDRPQVIYANVLNDGQIANLPHGCVEGPCLVDGNGVQPCHVGRLPEQLAALNRAHMAIHDLMADALLEQDQEKARYALLLDPLTAAVCSPAEISTLFDKMWQAQRDYLVPFERARDGRSR